MSESIRALYSGARTAKLNAAIDHAECVRVEVSARLGTLRDAGLGREFFRHPKTKALRAKRTIADAAVDEARRRYNAALLAEGFGKDVG